MTSLNLCFLAQYIFSHADNDTDLLKTHVNKAEEIIKLDFYLRLQNTENFALRAWNRQTDREIYKQIDSR